MARKKEPPKPISHLRFEFVDSLESLCHEAMMTVQVLSALIQLGSLSPAVKETLKERHDALRTALIGKDD